MDETKERLKLLIDFLTGPYLTSLQSLSASSCHKQTIISVSFDSDSFHTYIDDVANISTGGCLSSISQDDGNSTTASNIQQQTAAIKISDSNLDKVMAATISRQDIESIIKTLELCKKNMTHFATNERLYMMPLMTLCGHILLTETHLITRSHLSLVSEILVYILQFILGEISQYQEDESNYIEMNAVFLQQMKDFHLLSYDNEEYYRYFLKYRLIKFLSFMLLDDEQLQQQQPSVASTPGSSLSNQDLISLCQMLRMKSMPDTLRLHTTLNFETELASKTAISQPSNPITITSLQSSVKRIRLTTPGPLERNSKEEFFDQLLTPFILSTNIPTAASTPDNVNSSSSINTPTSISAAVLSTSEMKTSPLSMGFSPNSSNTIANAAAASTKIQSTQQIRSYLISHNQMYFQYIGGATSILNLINNYTLLRPYVLHLLAIEEGANLRLIRLDGNNFDLICDRIAADIDLVNSVFTLNRLLEPLSCDRISKMIVIVQACLNACLTLILHANQDPNAFMCSDLTELTKSELLTMKIIEKSLWLYNQVFDIFRQSNRVAGQISQNAHMFTAWMLFSGLQMILNSNKQTSTTLAKRQQGYSFLCIPLAKHALRLMSFLLDDLHLEFGDQNNILEDDDVSTGIGDDTAHNLQELSFFKKFLFNVPIGQCSSQSVTTTPNPTPVELSPSSSRTSIPPSSTGGTNGSTTAGTSLAPSTTSNTSFVRAINSTFKYNKFGHYSSWQRIDMILSSNLNVIHLLFSYLSAGYRRATLLRHSSCKLPNIIYEHGSSDSSSDNQFDEDEFLSFSNKISDHQKQQPSESSCDDYEDINAQHSILFEKFSEQQFNQQQNQETDIKKETSDLKTMLERDIDSHYELVISILDHLNYYYICSKIDALRSYFKQMLTDAQLIVLAHVMQDLDSEMDNIQTLSPLSSKTFYRFSSSLTSLMHNLIAMQILSDEQQNSLLAYLGFKPSLESECSWPLHHGVRSLAILAQIILLRQQKEQEDIKLDLNSTTIQIWRGFINKLKQAALSFKGELAFFDNECPDFQEDLNVEHAQLMLFLFHNLKLLQRKHVFSLVGLALNEISVKLNTNKCSISAAQIIFIGRLLHLFEYMCKNLYDTPSYLFEQINYNLLNLNRDHQPPPPNSKEDLSKINLDELEKYTETFRNNIKFFADKKLELNFFTYLISNYKSFSKKLPASNNIVNDLSSNFFDFIVHPRFYHLMDISIPVPKTSLLRNFKPRLDGIACNFMLAGFSSLTYDQFYNSLLNLLQFLAYQYDFDSKIQDEDSPELIRYPQFGAFGLCSIDYTFGTMWRLLNQLPPSLQYLQDIINTVDSSIQNEKNFVSIDASRILNMCVWIPRFTNNRPVCTWVADLLSKVGNNQSSDGSDSYGNQTSSVSIEQLINDLSKRFNSLEFNYHLLKAIAWPFFRYSHSSNSILNLSSIKDLLLTDQKQLIPLQYYQFPKFFTLFTMEIYLERVSLLFNEEFKPSKSSSSSKKSSTDHQKSNHELFENYMNLLLGLFDKIHNEINAVLLYDRPLSNAGRNDSADFNYLFYRSMVNICSAISVDANLSEISSNIFDFLPQSIVSKIDQWNRIYVNVDRNITDSELSTLFQKGILFDIPLIELPQSTGSLSTIVSSGSSKQPNFIYHFSAFMNEKYAIIDTPNVSSVDTGYANMTWTKLKQFMLKLFKFIELIYSKKESHQPSDPFVTCLMLQLNLVSNSLVTKLNENNNNSLSNQIFNKLMDIKDLKLFETYCTIVYLYFIGNAFFIMTIFNHPLFPQLKDSEKTKFQKYFQSCSLEFCKFFSKILKGNAGIWSFEEFLCDEAPSTPTGISPNQQRTTYPNYSLLNLIEVSSHPLVTSNYAISIMKMIKTLFSQSEKFPDDVGLTRLCSELSSALVEHQDRVQLLSNWFNLVLFHRTNEELIVFGATITKTTEPKFYIDDNSNENLYLFFKFICYAIKGTSRFDEIVLVSMAEALIQNAQTLITDTFLQSNNVYLYFSGLFTSLVHLMSAMENSDSSPQISSNPTGHFKLIHEIINWLTLCKDYLTNKESTKKMESSMFQGKQRFIIESSYQMLSYLSDIFNALEYKFVYLKNRKEQITNEDGSSSSKKEDKDKKELSKQRQISRLFIDDDYECEEDTVANESSEEIEDEYESEEQLAQKLCTFTQTQKEFVTQHWYHCHTCKMLDGVGVCSICAKVCHRNHDVTYSKNGSFFCDCGAKQDGSCKALVPRQPSNDKNNKERKKKNQTPITTTKFNSDAMKSIFDKKESMRISKYWYNSFYSLDSHNSKLADNYKMSKNKFSNQIIVQNYDLFGLKYEDLENYCNLVMSYIMPISDTILSLVEYFVPVLENFFQNDSELGYLSAIRKEFEVLRLTCPLAIEKCEQIMIPIKCFQEAVFDNVQITNVQSHPVRHLSLITGSIIRRVSMLVIINNLMNYSSSSILHHHHSQRSSTINPCLLVVAHDKNRLSIIQLNHLLGQVYSNSRKRFNMQKIAHVLLPFTIMTLSHNPLNDELLAVCGLKECHILSLARNGAITGHYSLTMQFDNNNHIIKTFWFPDSQTELAVVTLDFIKIYDLSREDRDTPIYNFVIPSRKIRDMTYFSCEENCKTKRFILIFSSRGHIYAQELNADSQCSTLNDIFYVTSILNVTYPDSWSSSCQQTLVGFSIHYSHLLQMLFVSYLNGSSFCGHFNIDNIYIQQITNVTPLDLYSTTSSSQPASSSTSQAQDLLSSSLASTTIPSTTASNSSSQLQPLFQWTEVLTHPGLVFAMTMNTNNPVCFMVKSKCIKVQELKPKKKIIDFAVVSTPMQVNGMPWTSDNNGQQSKMTTLISLCEDGSLRFHRATYEHTNFWLKPHFHNLDEVPTYSIAKSSKSLSSKLTSSLNEQATGSAPSSGQRNRFAVDFFERCTLMNDIEFGGSDVLEVYNTQQIKNRLNTSNMYIACTKPNGFSITVTQIGAFDQVMAGVRVNLGVCDPVRAPTAIEVFGRTIWVAINRHRWFDIPFTRSEMKKLMDTNTFNIRFAASGDPNQVTLVDNIRVYGRPRDSSGLSNEEDGSSTAAASATCDASSASSSPMDLLRRNLIQSNVRSSSTGSSMKMPVKKMRLLLYAPTITNDEMMTTVDTKYKNVFVVNRFVANSLDVIESLISFTKSLSELNAEQPSRQTIMMIVSARELINTNEYKIKCDQALTIASKLLTISLSGRLDKSICMLLAKLLANRSQYDEHRGEIIFESAIENLKQRAYNDINVFCYNLALFRETVNEHPRNFIRFIGKYFTQSSDTFASTIHFDNYLIDLFWRIYNQRPNNELLSPLTNVSQYGCMDSIVDYLVFILYSSTHAVLSNMAESMPLEHQQKIINQTSQLIVDLLCSPNPQISYPTKSSLVRILYSLCNYRHLEKQSKVSSYKQSSSSKSNGHRERRHSSGKHHSSSSTSGGENNASLNRAPTISNSSSNNEPSTSSGSIRRQGATRRARSSGANGSGSSSSWWTQRSYSNQSTASGSSNRTSSLLSGSANTAASLLEQVTESLLDSDFDPYHNLLMNIDSEFPYFQDLMANLRREQERRDEVYESITGDDDDLDDEEEDEDDDDEEDDEELDMASISQPETNGSSSRPPIFPMNSYSSESNANVQQPVLGEVIDEDVRVDEDDEDHDDDEDDEDEFEAMDEDEMMEIAIALSLQEQQRGVSNESRVIEEMVDFNEPVDIDRPTQASRSSYRSSILNSAINEIVDFHSQAQRERQNEPTEEQSQAAQEQMIESQQPQTSTQSEQGQQSHYSTLHSESDDDDEELFDDEIKLADTTMESIEAEEEHDDYDDDDEFNSMETSQHSSSAANLKTSKSISKSNETISKRSGSGNTSAATSSAAIASASSQQTGTGSTSQQQQPSNVDNNQSGEKSGSISQKCQKEAQKNRKRLHRLVASKFCLALLKEINISFAQVVKLNGIQSIPYLQVLTILSDFNYSECDQKEFCFYFNMLMKKMFDHLLKSDDFGETPKQTTSVTSPAHSLKSTSSSRKILTQYKERIKRKSENEVFLLTMRLFSIFLSYFKRFPTITWQTFLSKDLPVNESFRTSIVQATNTGNMNSTGKIAVVTFDEESIKASTSTTTTPPPTSTSSKSDSKSQIHNSLLLAAAQLIQSNGMILDYCYTMLHHLLKNYWRQLNKLDPDNSDNKNKSANANEQSIDYHSKKCIQIRSHMNFIPTDLRPFFTVLPDVQPSTTPTTLVSAGSPGSGTTAQSASTAAAQDASGVIVVNNITNAISNLSNTCTAINSVVFSNHVFYHYQELLTEMSLRLPYQLKKLISFLNGQSKDDDNKTDGKSSSQQPTINIEFNGSWIETLCEYMMLPSVSPYIRKQVRKLLSNLSGSKERYRQVRDYYAIKTNLRSVRRIIVMHFFDSSNSSNMAFKLQDLGMNEEDLDDEEQLDELIRIIIGTVIQNDDKSSTMMSSDQHRLLNLPYSELINLVDYLKACLDIASTRVHNWQRLCRREVRIVPFLFRISFLFGEGISSIILQLLSLALFSDKNPSSKKPEENNLTNNLILNVDKNKTKESGKSEKASSHQGYICCYVFIVLERQLLSHFIKFFLLESNSSQQRWATHSLMYMFFESLQPVYQEQFLQLFWQLWPNIACYGKRASQFVDLLGYFTLTLSKSNNNDNNAGVLRMTNDNERLYAESAIGLLRYQNQVLIKHPNSNIYNSLQSLLDLNGYYLETEPCLVCNNPEINFIQVKSSAIKMDSRFTTNTQIVKLIGAHTISKITVKISELKKSKMVKTLCIYYNNRWVQSVVELKNKNTIWHKAKRITLTPSQSEVKIEFALPIVACNLMIEYSDFYETSHSSTETLQCPRCSSVVLANPGVCTNCGENVFQCHKCRAINYDEKDPFLCNSCGFCKYAKFDYVLTARYTASAVEAIENEEDRSKAVQTINNLLDKADRLYKIILSIRPTLENLLLASQDYHSTLYNTDSIDTGSNGNATTTSGVGSSTSTTSAALNSSSSTLFVNRYIHQLASRYSNDCRVHFEELSKIVQKILYTRKELVDYDNRQNDNRHNFEDIKRLLQEHRQDFAKTFGGSSTSLSSTSSSTLVDLSASTSAAIKKQCKQALSASDEHYQGGEIKKKKLSNDENIRFDFKSGRCYGCASATIEHCIILLKALVHNSRYKIILSSSNLFRELIDYNLRIGTPSFRNKVRALLCLLIRDDLETTEEFNNLLLEKIGSVLQTRFMTSFDFGSIRHEMSLLASSFENEDNCWEQRLRCVMKLFLLSLQNKSPAVLEAITLPCLRILYGLIIKPSLDNKSEIGKNVTHSANTVEQLASVQSTSNADRMLQTTQIPFDSLMVNVSIDLNQWLSADNKSSSFSSWQQRNMKIPARSTESDPNKTQLEEYLERKYFSRWLYLHQTGRIRNLKSECFIVRIASSTWIQEVLFNPTSKALRNACRQLLMALFERLTSKQRVLIDLFTSFLDDLCQVDGEVGLEFYDLYRSIVFSEFSLSANLAKNGHWRYYLTLCGLLQHLGQLISTEIDRLKQLEESTLSSDFSQGSALRRLVQLMQLFMYDERIRRVHKSSMVGFVLDGYLSLRKLIVQRTKMIDETQAALLELLELLTTGTKTETINFMKVCIESVKKCSLQDLRTPVFIFERLCSIIHPEEKDTDEFFISLEKDPQQEDFLQGRMLGNPYSSKDSGMGPLMRDIKNKICQECELVSLLEDDSGLELLVNNKIISLDLPVKEVYKKIVCADAQASNQSAPVASVSNSWSSGNGNLNLGSDIAAIDNSVFQLNSNLNANNNSSSVNSSGPTMKIVYRIRGLMGDATEEFIENLSNKESIVKDDEKLFELANIMSQSSGLSVMLERLQAINEINNRSRNLVFVLLKLFGFCVRVVSNRRALIQPELKAISIMLGIVRLFLKNPQAELLTVPSSPGEPSYFEQLLAIMETLLAEASNETPEEFDLFNKETCGQPEDIQLLINSVSSPKSIIFTANVASLNNRILRVVTFLSIGHPEKMTTLINNFRPFSEFDDYDTQNLQVENPDHWYELFCTLVSAIERNHNGARLKDRMIEEGFIMMAIDYLVRNAPTMKSFVLLNSEEWKEFASRPALKYVLKMLTGMSRGHEPTRTLITKEGVPIIHALEQVLSDSHMATLAENLMDALKESPSVEAKIEEIRLRTREEKKRIAMAVREKQLGELGMKANDKGQVMADSDLLKKMEDELKEEKGLVCSICREGYSYQPQKVLAIYTFTKRCNVEEFEEKSRKTLGYTTVTHFNIVHVECHMDAVRHARTRDEWQSASLHNANTRCNGLLPLWGPSVFESLFVHALSRHNSYLQDAIGQRDFVGTNSFLGTVHDLKLLLLRFAQEKSFSEETGGGGAQSNLYLTPYLMHTALYVMNTTKVTDRERNNFEENFMKQTAAKLIETSFQVDGAFFYSTMVLLLHPPRYWRKNRLYFLRRLILCQIIRSLPKESRNVETIATHTEPSYSVIKPALMFFSLINFFYTIMFKSVEGDWSQALVDYIRHNDQSLLEASDKILDTFENDILLSASFAEFCDATDLLRGSDAILDPEQFLKDTVTQLSPAESSSSSSS